MKVIHWYILEGGLSEEVAAEVATHVRVSSVCLYWSKWYTFFHWCCGGVSIHVRPLFTSKWIFSFLKQEEVLGSSHERLQSHVESQVLCGGYQYG